MNTTILQKRLLELLPSNIQLLYGLLKSGGVVVDKTNETITINQPYQYIISELTQQRDLVLQEREQYLRQIQLDANDSTATIPLNEEAMFSDIIKVYEVVLQQLS